MVYLFPDAGEDDDEGDEERYEDDAEGDGGHVAGHRRTVGVIVERRTAVVTKGIEPASHSSFLLIFFNSDCMSVCRSALVTFCL